jgi:glucose-6-phosphate isomerase
MNMPTRRRSASFAQNLPMFYRLIHQGTKRFPCDSIGQWGVKPGKALAQRVAPEPESANESPLKHDGSTNALIRGYRHLNNGPS